MFEKDVVIKGVHATYIKHLTVTKEEDGLFFRYIDVYLLGSILGLLHNRKSQEDNSSKDTARIFAEVFIKEKSKCEFLYRLVMLHDDAEHYTKEERLDRAFRDDANEKNVEDNLNIFHSYALGGIEFLYDKFQNTTTREDMLDSLYSFVNKFYEDNHVPVTDIDERIHNLIE